MNVHRPLLAVSAALLIGMAMAQTTTGTPPAGAPPGPPPAGNPPGPPPNGNPPGPPPGGAGDTGGPTTCSATLVVDGKTLTLDGQAYQASAADASGVCAINKTALTLTGLTVTTTGASSNSDSSSFYGLNAGVLALNGASVTLTGAKVTTSGNGGNDVFAYGAGTRVTLTGGSIAATGQYAHGIMTAGGGEILATNLTASTTGANGAVIATDRGGGTIVVTGGDYRTSGADSPGLYSTGTLKVNGATITATGAEAAVIEGSNQIEVTGSRLSGAKKSGVMLYQSFSGDALGSDSHFTMTGGSLTATEGPLFYVTNASGTVNLTGVTLSATSGTLLNAAADKWGTAGSNGGHATLNATQQTLTGTVTADKDSEVALTLRDHSTLAGSVNPNGTARTASLTLDATSTWTASGTSHLTTLAGATVQGNTLGNVKGSGTITYDATQAANAYLGGKTYPLDGGGTLKPS